MQNEYKRRTFLQKIGFSLAAISFISLNPLKIFAAKKKHNLSNIIIKVNPRAVKRNKLGKE